MLDGQRLQIHVLMLFGVKHRGKVRRLRLCLILDCGYGDWGLMVIRAQDCGSRGQHRTKLPLRVDGAMSLLFLALTKRRLTC